jgi:hypothetical protein
MDLDLALFTTVNGFILISILCILFLNMNILWRVHGIEKRIDLLNGNEKLINNL